MKIRSFNLIIPVLLFIFPLLNIQATGPKKQCNASSGDDEVIVTAEDSLIFSRLVDEFKEEALKKMPFSEVIVQVGRFFYEEPYVAHTLEVGETEKLVVNLREFDCTTYIENVLALSYCLKSGSCEFQNYIEHLRVLRYRKGEVDGYPSRLHYFSEWLKDNQEKGLVEIISNEMGDGKFNSEVGFMSANSEKYDRLSGNAEHIQAIQEAEKRVSEYEWKYVTPEHLDQVSEEIKNGDIIAFCSSIEGLDVTHTGFAHHTNEGLYFMHASMNGDKVRLSEKSLKGYILGRENVYGILVGRPVMPAGK
ncbi:MAG: N-acetylmuramoyl-L-alanine amidase-like domain-containing protein [Bacteroidota bacterium]